MSLLSRLAALEKTAARCPCVVCQRFDQPTNIKVLPDYTFDQEWPFPCERCGFEPESYPTLADVTGNSLVYRGVRLGPVEFISALSRVDDEVRVAFLKWWLGHTDVYPFYEEGNL